MDNSASESRKTGIWQGKALRFGTVILLTLVVMYGAIGIFSRPMLDDFCLAARANNWGVIGTVSFQFWNWSGNVIGLYYQVVGAVFYLHPISPLALLTLWVVTFSWFLWEIFVLVGLPRKPLLAVFLGALLTLTMIDSSANQGQSLYWLNGTANYGPMSALFIMLLALLLRTLRQGARRTTYIAAVLLTFIAVCGQITMTIFCMGLLALLLLFTYFYPKLPHRPDLLRVLIVALASGAVGAALVILTPGNDIRQIALNSVGRERLSVMNALLQNVPYALGMMGLSAAIFAPFAHVLLIAIGHLGASILRPTVLNESSLPKHYRPFILFTGLGAGFIVYYIGGFASTYSMGALGPPRAWVPPQSLWIVIVLVTSYLHGLCYQPVALRNVSRIRFNLLLCVTGFVLLQFVNWVSLIPPYRNFAQQHETRIAAIEDALNRGDDSVIIPPYQPTLTALMALNDGDDLLCLRWYYPIDIQQTASLAE